MNSVTVPDGVIRAIEPVDPGVLSLACSTHRFPSAPTVMSSSAPGLLRGYSTIWLCRRSGRNHLADHAADWTPSASVNQMFPSGPSVIPSGIPFVCRPLPMP